MINKKTAIPRAAASINRLFASLCTGTATGEHLETAYRDGTAALNAGATGDDVYAACKPFDIAAEQSDTPSRDAARRAAALVLSAIAKKLEVSEDDLDLELAVHAENTSTRATATVTGTTIDIDPDTLTQLIDRLAGEITGRATHDTIITLVDTASPDGSLGAFAWSAAGGFPALYSKQADMMAPAYLCWWSDDDFIPDSLVDHPSETLDYLSKYDFDFSARTAGVLQAHDIRLN